MKIAINCGHTLSGAGYGAVSGKYRESEITRLIGKEVSRLLKSKGHTVYDCTVDKASTQNEYLREVVVKERTKDADLFISLHLNASPLHTGNGVEVYTYKKRKNRRRLTFICGEKYESSCNSGRIILFG